MKNYLTLFFFLSTITILLSQPQVGIRAGVYGFNEEVLFPNGAISWLENELDPSVSGELFFAQHFTKSNWLWTGSVSYQRFSCEAEIPFMYTYESQGREIPVFTTGMRTEFDNVVGFSLGIGYEFRNRNESQSFKMEIGGRLLGSVQSGMRIEIEENPDLDFEDNSDREFSERIISGCFFRPSYQFRIGDKNSPWTAVLFMEGNMLWRNKAPVTNPVFTYGGGLGISFALESKGRNGLI
ncbi:hypothetical protein Oweho_2685 [Owenweeksia hongkongensis DSM 17368]|uniref:Outer membrane protein beta-barrel domain-containing protein n=1 Tax=Owenweeksia hongkongensis (strain DSM 17368 / CIP 108786 / JCM 12287 / NRRL B-23963 / UST20020801) TaxID=926562 RepID=G8QZJ6_OWEHD|nr:hypothetical protein [Owenweeksia hongkongensis]AEV33649.1 hypothetical protein Oweho_2685 [Owenweeksia hongkongensis DSM 17368]